MSLHALAGHMAAKGRGSDSMLVHMTPEEVQSLQVLALRAGGTLTINPETGLPEANFLKKMLPMIAGFALGPAGFGLMSAGMAGAAVGGITALSTGSLSRGLMAGLGAYGGASLGASLAGAGEGAIAAGDIAAQQAAKTFPTLAEGASQEAIAKYATDVGAVRDAALSKAGQASLGSKLSAGFGQMASNPGAYTREMLTGFAAISPVLADQGVKTATRRPDTGYIRNYTFDPYGQTYSDAGSYPASEYKGMAQGGVVALAAGGDYRSLTKDSSAADIASAYKQFTTAGGGDTEANRAAALDYLTNTLGIDQGRIGQAYTQFQASPTYTDYTQQNVLDYFRDNKNIDIAAETARLNANPLLVNQTISQLGLGFLDPTQTARGSGTLPFYDLYTGSGIDANELFAANLALDPNYAFAGKRGAEGISALQRAFDVAGTVKGFNPAGADQFAKDIEWVKMMDREGYNATDIARATGLSIGEVQAREAAARAAMQPKIVTQPPIVTTLPDNITQVTDTLPGGVSGGGNTVLNSNGTITTAPNIPGRPVGGFTGMEQLRNVYTQGGGSLGYVNRAPKTMEEFNQRFNTQTGDSLAAYNYLIGKGANPIKSGVGEIMRPYSEAVRGVPVAEGRPSQKYIYQNGRYVENPNYRPLSYNSKGERMVGLTRNEVIKGIQGLKDPADNGALFDFVTDNRISEAQLAAALGISITEARARLAAGKRLRVGNRATDLANYLMDGGGGDASGSSGSAGASGSGDAAGDAAAAAADGAAAAAGDGAGPGTGAGWAYGGEIRRMALGGLGGLGALAAGGSASQYNLGSYSDGGRLLRGPGDGVSDSIPATIGGKQPARLADGEFVIPARIVSELGNGSTEAGARKLYAMMDRVQKARRKTTGKKRVAVNTRADKYLPA